MKGQTTVEYVILVGLVITAIYMMGPSLKRGVQAMVKGTADQLATQQNAEQDFSPEGSHLAESMTNTQVRASRSVRDRLYTVNTAVDERAETTTNTVTNMGFAAD